MDLDEFSDDGFDDIPTAALQELENHAIQFTQTQNLQRHVKEDSQEGYGLMGWDEEEDEDLDTTEVTNDVGVPVGRPPGSKAPPQQQPDARPAPPPPNPRWNPAIDPPKRQTNDAAASANLASRQRIAPVGAPRQAYAGSQHFQAATTSAAQLQPSQFARPPLPQTRYNASQASQAPAVQPSGNMLSALQQRVRALEAELNAARGEASIIRSNATKQQQQHDAEVNRLKKLNAEQMAKQERIVEAAVAAEKTASTELQFLQRDLKEVNDRARRKDHGGAGGAGASFGTVTPKKTTKSWGFADGFDDMDLIPSPSKGQGRGRGAGSVAVNVGERTPTKGKRKRPMMDSPVTALETHTDDGDVPMMDDLRRPTTPAQSSVVVQMAPSPPFDFLPLILDHGSLPNQPPTFDLLSRFSFPSEPSVSFSSIIFQKLSLMGDPNQPMQLLVDFTELIVSIWVRCVEDRYWEPIKHLVALISFTLQLHTTTVAIWTFRNLAAAAQTTIFMVAEGRHRVPDGDLSKNETYSGVAEHIDTTYILALLQLVAIACATTPVKTEIGLELQAEELWRMLTLDFVLLLLTPKQKLEDVIAMLGLLSTSTLPKSIGPLVEDKDPTFVARLVIERVSAKLVEFPVTATLASDKRRIRIAALRTLISFARHPFGALALASHNNAIPRLVACMSTSIDDLYDQPIPAFILPPPSDDLPPPPPDSSATLSTIISQCVLLIHTLVTSPSTAETADIAGKLSVSHGGSQRYLLSLGRLTFAEDDLVLEAGIEAEVVEAAHELLEMAVTPDEGELVSEAFGA
ncbi:DNA repair protein Rad26 [Sarocladium implicatum]|nr:DNA repair protein Rad26 [Sarocladium implicatum]